MNNRRYLSIQFQDEKVGALDIINATDKETALVQAGCRFGPSHVFEVVIHGSQVEFQKVSWKSN